MKTFYICIAAFLSISTTAALSQDMAQAKSLLEQVVQKKIQQRGESWAEPSVVIDNGASSLRKLPEFVKLEQMARTDWPQMMNNLETVAPDRLSKTVLFVAFQSLPIDDYLQFLDQAVGMAEKKVIDKQLLDWALFPWDYHVRAVLDYNYEKPVVKDILQRVKVLYADDPKMTGSCDGILSGAAKKEMDEYYDEGADSRPVPALQGLSTNSATPTNAVSFVKTNTIPTVAKAAPHPYRLVTWIVVGAIMLIIGGVFKWKIRS